MKRILTTLLASLALAASALAHGDVELGPNGGRLVPFGEKNPLHAEVTLDGSNFVIGLYDEEAKKMIPAASQVLTITQKETNKKLEPVLKDGKWTVAKPAGKDFWLIMTLKDDPKGKSRVGRLHYDETICPDCGAQEWVCRCSENKGKKK